MKKVIVIVFLIIIIFILISVNSNSVKVEKADSKLLKAVDNGKVDVIVRLKENVNIPGIEREFSSFNGFHKEVSKKIDPK